MSTLKLVRCSYIVAWSKSVMPEIFCLPSDLYTTSACWHRDWKCKGWGNMASRDVWISLYALCPKQSSSVLQHGNKNWDVVFLFTINNLQYIHECWLLEMILLWRKDKQGVILSGPLASFGLSQQNTYVFYEIVYSKMSCCIQLFSKVGLVCTPFE